MIGRALNAIVIHCSATPNGQPFTASAIDLMHAARGFKRQPSWVKQFNSHLPAIGYHYFIGVDGLRSSGRHLEEIGAHVQGSNARSIGICMAGMDRFTALQWIALKALLLEIGRTLGEGRLMPVKPGQPYPLDTPDRLLAGLAVMNVKVCGHRDFSPDLDGDGVIERHEFIKTCPGFDVQTWLRAGMTAQPAHLC